ncbi:ABC transporter permease [Dolichospermum sp. ST_sed1]|nr:ABC transporter permease [Dolichospermum sp. ST_sed1]
MLNFIIKRLLHMIPILFGVALFTFVLFNVFGEDPVRLALGNHATPASIAALQAKWGLDQPIHIQFLEYLRQIVMFDYGVSFSTGKSLMETFQRGALISLQLTVPPFIMATFIGICFALMLSYYREGILDKTVTAVVVVMMSISYLVYIIVFQYMFTYYWPIFPVQGFESGIMAVKYLSLPWIILFIVTIGPDIRIFRSVFLDEVKNDYIRTARAKGATEGRVMFVHLLKNAMIPIITYTVAAIPGLIAGAFLMEKYFGIPGVGSMTITAINEGDFPILKSFTILMAFLYASFNLITDILYAAVDPRVKLG